jgi:hypothetical protein
MKKTKKVECQKLDEVVCDICGQSCKKTHNNEFASLSATWGYDSKKDLTRHDIDLCEGCFDKTIEFLQQIRTANKILILGKDQNTFYLKPDPLDGLEYGLT